MGALHIDSKDDVENDHDDDDEAEAIMTIVMTMRNIMMLSDAPGSSGAGTQRAKDDGGEGWRRPEH